MRASADVGIGIEEGDARSTATVGSGVRRHPPGIVALRPSRFDGPSALPTMDRSDRGLLWVLRTVSSGQTGVNRYVVELCRALAAHPGNRSYDLCVAAEPADPEWLPDDMGLRRVPGPRRLVHAAWTFLEWPPVERLVRPAAFVHTLSPSLPVPSVGPSVVTVHDLFPVTNPEWYAAPSRVGFQRAMARAEQEAAAVIVDSMSTCRSALAAFPGLEGRTTVIPLGISEQFRQPVSSIEVAAVCRRLGVVPGRYVLAVGQIGRRKNLPVAVDALARSSHRDLDLLVVGPEGDGVAELEAAADRAGLAGRLRRAGWVPDGDLVAVVAGALLLIHPSVAEGFGFTPLESMAAGTPAFVAAEAGLPDVVGSVAVHLPVDDPDRWAEAIDRVADDDDWRAELVVKGREWSSRFTWAETGRRTAALHDSVAGSGRS